MKIKDRKAHKLRKGGLWDWKIAAAVVLTSVVTSSFAAIAGFERVLDDQRISPNTWIDDVEVSGMTKKECTNQLQKRNASRLKAVEIPVRASNDKVNTFGAKELGVSLDTKRLVKSALDAQKSRKSVLERYKDISTTKKELNSKLVIDEEKLEKSVSGFLSGNSKEEVSAIDEAGVIAAVKEALDSGDGKEISITEIAQRRQDAPLSALPEGNELIAKYTTVSGSDENRDINLKTMSEALNGTALEPGQVFSILNDVGPTTEEKGYVMGPTITGGADMGESVGGGVCQVVTTLYNAALLSDVEIVSRTKHSIPVDYAPVGMDATINWDNIDFKVRNPYTTPLYIYAAAEKGNVEVRLYGQPLEEGVSLEASAEILKEIEPDNEEIILTPGLADGERKVKQEAQPGYEVVVYKNRYKDGELVKKEEVSHDTYEPVAQIVLVGSSKNVK